MKYSKYKIHYCIFCQVKSQILNQNISKISDILNLAKQEVNGSDTSLDVSSKKASLCQKTIHGQINHFVSTSYSKQPRKQWRCKYIQWWFKYID